MVAVATSFLDFNVFSSPEHRTSDITIFTDS
jgi:hypothetical protein